MAKRKRLTLSPLMPLELDSGSTEPAGLEIKAFLRPGLGAPAPIARVAADAAAQAALSEMSQAMERARNEGRLVLALGLDQIDADHLLRDRIGAQEEELDQLMASLRDHGQRAPIEVTNLGNGRYGLISGWRRLQALSRLFEQTADARFGQVLALLRHPQTAQDAYIAMVEENEIRLALSYYERARIAARSVDAGVFETERQALQRLFATASRARRSKIGSFLAIYRQLNAVLRFPAALPERQGLALAQALEVRAAEVAGLVEDLARNPAPDAGTELARLARFVTGKPDAGAPPVPKTLRQELRPGVFLDISGGFVKPVLTLSGPAVGPEFRSRLEHWLTTGK